MQKKSAAFVIQILAMLGALVSSGNAVAELPDYYAEPGFNAYRDYHPGDMGELADPFSGGLRLSHVDLYVPMNGAMNLAITRTYSSGQGTAGVQNPYGFGWAMHFGKISKSNNIPCETINDVVDAPVFETPDGGMQTLLPNDAQSTFSSAANSGVVSGSYSAATSEPTNLFSKGMTEGGSSSAGACAGSGCSSGGSDGSGASTGGSGGSSEGGSCAGTSCNGGSDGSGGSSGSTGSGMTSGFYVTQQRWRAYCREFSIGNQTNQGFVLTSPEGTQYEFGWMGNGSTPTWYVTKVKDIFDNWYQINYSNTNDWQTRVDSIQTSDGQTISYTYTTQNSYDRRLVISHSGRSWTYNYRVISGHSGYYFLKEVIRPDQKKWLYSYLDASSQSGSANYLNLTQVTHPQGGSTSYTYKKVQFELGNAMDTYALDTKTTSSTYNVVGGVWNYNYYPSGGTSQLDRSEVTQPDGTRTEYFHVGIKTVSGSSMWTIGQLKEKRIYNPGVTNPVQTEIYAYGKQKISELDYKRSSRNNPYRIDSEHFATVQTYKKIVRDGSTFETMNFASGQANSSVGSFDDFGNPLMSRESGPNQSNRTTNYGYYIDGAKWLIHKLDTEAVSGISGIIDRTFYTSTGAIQTESKYGVTTIYEYHDNGELYRVTDANGKITEYPSYRPQGGNNYHRGVPRYVSMPEGKVIEREVNSDGTIQWEKNGRGHVTHYQYDGLGRITFIDFPRGDDLSISHTTLRQIQYNRGSNRYRKTIELDGLGRTINTTAADMQRSSSVFAKLELDALGRTRYAYNPNTSSGTTNRTETQYDGLGRIKRVVNPDSSQRNYSYQSANKVAITDEENVATTYTYQSFGNPDEKEVIEIRTQDGNETTIARNTIGQMELVTQAGITRDYIYNAKQQVWKIIEPETGATEFLYDNVGNVKNKRVGTSDWTTFIYDGLNRMTDTLYPAAAGSNVATPNLHRVYDKNNNLTLAQVGDVTRNYDYDENNNLRWENMTIDGQEFRVDYAINEHDQLAAITYPQTNNGRRYVDYNPDWLGRPQKVGGVATNVAWNPNGSVYQINYANGRTTTFDLNNRQWPQSITTDNAAATISYTYFNNGNVKAISGNPMSGLSLTYDTQNRLRTATGPWGGGNVIDYDNAGNITQKNIGTKNIAYYYNQGNSNNRLDKVNVSGVNLNFAYDTYGNVISDGLYNYAYDHAGNLRDIDTIGASFSYDAEARRVRKTKNGFNTYYFYSQSGDLLGEYQENGNYKEFFQLANATIAMAEETAGGPPGGIIITSPGVNGVDVDGKFSIAWQDSGADYYEVQLSTDPAFGGGSLIVYSGNETSADIVVTENGTYYIRVRACDAQSCSEWSSGSQGINVQRLFVPIAVGDITIFIPMAD